MIVKEVIDKAESIQNEEESPLDLSFPYKKRGKFAVRQETQIAMATRRSPPGLKLDFEICVPGIEEMSLTSLRGGSLTLSLKLHEVVVEEYLTYAKANGLNFMFTLSSNTLNIYGADVICFFNDLMKICECRGYEQLSKCISNSRKRKYVDLGNPHFFKACGHIAGVKKVKKASSAIHVPTSCTECSLRSCGRRLILLEELVSKVEDAGKVIKDWQVGLSKKSLSPPNKALEFDEDALVQFRCDVHSLMTTQEQRNRQRAVDEARELAESVRELSDAILQGIEPSDVVVRVSQDIFVHIPRDMYSSLIMNALMHSFAQARQLGAPLR